jgi:hypothetical protein
MNWEHVIRLTLLTILAAAFYWAIFSVEKIAAILP